MKIPHTAVLLALVVLTTGCGQKAQNDTNAVANANGGPAAAMDGMPANMSTVVAAEHVSEPVKGSGTVTATDKAAGTITINHAPIPAANWPAMTMPFAASPALIESVKAGDKVTFDLDLKDGAGKVTAIAKD